MDLVVPVAADPVVVGGIVVGEVAERLAMLPPPAPGVPVLAVPV